MKAIVTTAGRTNEVLIAHAKEIANELSLVYVDRKKKSVQALQEQYESDIIVITKERLELFTLGSATPFFFHPNSAAFRMKRLLKGEQDLFLQATGLIKGDRFLDTTAGLCSDSMIAAYEVGDAGVVHACEANVLVAFIVSSGLQQYETPIAELQHSMRQIQLIHQDSIQFLKAAETDAYDVVYLDPMFEEEIEESSNFQTLRKVGQQDALSAEWVAEAKRVARKRVVLKAHFRSSVFEEYGFTRFTRLTAKFHYGIIEK